MVEKYPNLVWALNSNEELKLILFETCKDKPRYLFYLDDLILSTNKIQLQRHSREN